ncbi:unnamed protein product [Ixodes pacificus]
MGTPTLPQQSCGLRRGIGETPWKCITTGSSRRDFDSPRQRCASCCAHCRFSRAGRSWETADTSAAVVSGTPLLRGRSVPDSHRRSGERLPADGVSRRRQSD